MTDSDSSSVADAIDRIAERTHYGISEITDPTLAGGLAGAVTFLASLDHCRGLHDGYDAYLELLEPSLAERDGSPSLHNGWLGAHWAATRIVQLRDDCSYSEAVERLGIDLTAELEDGIQDPSIDFDIANGLAGVVAALRQADHEHREHIARLIERRLTETADWDPSVRPRWPTPWWRMRQRHKAPHYDLGLYHGNPGVALALAWLHDDLSCAPLLPGFLEWLRANLGGDLHIHASLQSGHTRIAWCYGHPGVACALVKVADTLQDENLLDFAVRASSHAATLGVPGPSYDPFWCHGSAGLLYMYWSFARATGSPTFVAAQEKWMSFLLSQIDDLERQGWPCGLGLVDGLSGIGMCLLTVSERVPPTWESVMAIDFGWSD